jgi:hypothetical protein
MATKYECDVCHRQFDKQSEIRTIELPDMEFGIGGSTSIDAMRPEFRSDDLAGRTVSRDVCRFCAREAHKTLWPKEKVAAG